MPISLNVKLTRDQIEEAVRRYVALELPQHSIEGKLKWAVTKGGGDMRESWPDSVNFVEFTVVTKTPYPKSAADERFR